MRDLCKKIMLLVMVAATMSLTACLPDDKDPDKSSDAGKLSGAFYASGLGSVALQIQNAIVGNASWFNNLSTAMELNLAAMGIAADGLGSPIKSNICPLDSGTGVRQITWINGHDINNRFSVKGIGTDAGSIMAALRTRVAGDQVGIYNSGSQINLANGTTMDIPSSCGSINIPAGAPVVAFEISRPAPPTSEMARTEYRTVPCGVDATGRQRRGTQVQSRNIQYMPDGTIQTAAWSTESMGQCVDDVVVQITDRTFTAGAGNADLNNFAAIALRNLLAQQLQMDCTVTNVRSDRDVNNTHEIRNKNINTCQLHGAGTGTLATNDTDLQDGSDSKTLDCKGSTILMLLRFVNLYAAGTSTTTWDSGHADIVRVLDNRNNEGQQARRYKWLGQNINCGGHETFFAPCSIIPGNPALVDRASWTKWIGGYLPGYEVHNTWLNGVFGVCWFGSCEQVLYATYTYLNPDYFTGIEPVQLNGTTTYRGMAANSWLNNETFQPYSLPSTPWHISDNQCLWSDRRMIVDCPFNYDANLQSNWSPQYVGAAAGRPTTLDPGMGSNGTASGNIYSQLRNQGKLVANTTVYWESCDIKGCDHWSEGFGPGTGAFIKSWNTSTMTVSNDVPLSSEAINARNTACSNVAYQLQATQMAQQAQAAAAAAQTTLANAINYRQTQYDTQNTLNGLLNDANNSVSVLSSTVSAAHTDAVNKRNTADAELATYNDMVTEENNYANYGGAPPNPYTHYTAGQLSAQQQVYVTADSTASSAESLEATANANLSTAQSNAGSAQTAVTNQQAVVAAAEADVTNKTTAYNNAVAAAVAAQQNADASLAHPLTADERSKLETVNANICSSPATTLDDGQQGLYRATCQGFYDNPSAYMTILPSFQKVCDVIFDRRGPGNADCNTPAPTDANPNPAPLNCPGNTLVFRKPNLVPPGGDVQTTLLNTEGVRLAWRPQIENNNTLITRQHGFVDPLMCARSEYDYISWPLLKYYWQCGGKGGCTVGAYWTSVTVTHSVVREWSGLSYETGTWSAPQEAWLTPYGTYYSYSSIPSYFASW